VRAFVLLALALGGCAHLTTTATTVVTDHLVLPQSLVKSICGHQGYPFLPDGMHWDGQAHLMWDTNHEVLALNCGLTYLHGVLETLQLRVPIGSDRAKTLREFLAANNIPIADFVPISTN
jgi:hypothetical protein